MHHQLTSVLPLGSWFSDCCACLPTVSEFLSIFLGSITMWVSQNDLRISTGLSLHLDSYAPLNPFNESGNFFSAALNRAVKSTDLMSVSRYAETRCDS